MFMESDSVHIQIYKMNELLAEFNLAVKSKSVTDYKCYTENILDMPFGRNMHPDYARVMNLLEERCWDRNRPDIGLILDTLGLQAYDPVDIVRKTHGLKHCDYIWLKFDTDSDEVTYDKIKIRD